MTSLTSWQGLHEVLPIIMAEASRTFLCGFYCFSGIVIITLNRLYECTRWMEEIMPSFDPWSGFGSDDSYPFAYTGAKYTGIMQVLL